MIRDVVSSGLTKRVPVDVVLFMLAQSGIHTNARTIRNWRLRGHITRTVEGYDLEEIVAYVTERKLDLRVSA